MTSIQALGLPEEMAPPAGTVPDLAVVKTRFGEVAIDRGLAIEMPRGLLGFADHRSFGLATLPDPRFVQFKLLVNLADPAISFLVLPIDLDAGIIELADIEAACQGLAIAREDIAALVIVTIRRIAAEARVSVNLRAPIFIDTRERRGWQFVLSSGRYPVRQELTLIGVDPTP